MLSTVETTGNIQIVAKPQVSEFIESSSTDIGDDVTKPEVLIEAASG